MSTETNDPILFRLVDEYLDARVRGFLAQRKPGTDGMAAAIAAIATAIELRCHWNATPGLVWREGADTYTSADTLLAALDARATAFADVMAAQQVLTSTEGASHG